MYKQIQKKKAVSIFSVAALNYDRFSNELEPLVRTAKKTKNRMTSSKLRVLIGKMKDRTRREEAVSQLERIETSLKSKRWHTGAAGQVLELTCTDGLISFYNLLPNFLECMDFLYLWNEENAAVITDFFSHISSWSLPWASPSDIWRAVIPTEQIRELAIAVDKMTPREMRKFLIALEDGLVYSKKEAEEISEWWGSVRKQVRLANRRKDGLLVTIRKRS